MESLRHVYHDAAVLTDEGVFPQANPSRSVTAVFQPIADNRVQGIVMAAKARPFMNTSV